MIWVTKLRFKIQRFKKIFIDKLILIISFLHWDCILLFLTININCQKLNFFKQKKIKNWNFIRRCNYKFILFWFLTQFFFVIRKEYHEWTRTFPRQFYPLSFPRRPLPALFQAQTRQQTRSARQNQMISWIHKSFESYSTAK